MKVEAGLLRLGLGEDHLSAVHQVVTNLIGAVAHVDFTRGGIGAQRGHASFLGAAAAGSAGVGESALGVWHRRMYSSGIAFAPGSVRVLVVGVFESFQCVPTGVRLGVFVHFDLLEDLIHFGVALAFGMNVADGQMQCDALEKIVREVHLVGVNIQRHEFFIIDFLLIAELEDLTLFPEHRLAHGRVAMVAGHVQVAVHVDRRNKQVLAFVQVHMGFHFAAQLVFLHAGGVEERLTEKEIERMRAVLQTGKVDGMLGEGLHMAKDPEKPEALRDGRQM